MADGTFHVAWADEYHWEVVPGPSPHGASPTFPTRLDALHSAHSTLHEVSNAVRRQKRRVMSAMAEEMRDRRAGQ